MSAETIFRIYSFTRAATTVSDGGGCQVHETAAAVGRVEAVLTNSRRAYMAAGAVANCTACRR